MSHPFVPWLECDLGEGEPRAISASLLARIDGANVACGGHAGDAETIAFCLERARAEGVRAGAHPGLSRPGSFGRGAPEWLTPSELIDLLDEQVGRFATIAAELSVPVHHVKLHGTLYHQVDDDSALGAAYVEHVARRWPQAAILARGGGPVARLARSLGRPVLREAFLDRGYRKDGTLVPRGDPDALVLAPDRVLERIRSLRERGGWPSTDGTWVPIEAEALCVHGDSPGAPTLLERVRIDYPRDRRPPLPFTVP